MMMAASGVVAPVVSDGERERLLGEISRLQTKVADLERALKDRDAEHVEEVARMESEYEARAIELRCAVAEKETAKASYATLEVKHREISNDLTGAKTACDMETRKAILLSMALRKAVQFVKNLMVEGQRLGVSLSTFTAQVPEIVYNGDCIEPLLQAINGVDDSGAGIFLDSFSNLLHKWEGDWKKFFVRTADTLDLVTTQLQAQAQEQQAQLEGKIADLEGQIAQLQKEKEKAVCASAAPRPGAAAASSVRKGTGPSEPGPGVVRGGVKKAETGDSTENEETMETDSAAMPLPSKTTTDNDGGDGETSVGGSADAGVKVEAESRSLCGCPHKLLIKSYKDLAKRCTFLTHENEKLRENHAVIVDRCTKQFDEFENKLISLSAPLLNHLQKFA